MILPAPGLLPKHHGAATQIEMQRYFESLCENWQQELEEKHRQYDAACSQARISKGPESLIPHSRLFWDSLFLSSADAHSKSPRIAT